MTEKFFKFGENCKPTGPRNLMKPQQKKQEEDYSKAHHNQIVRRYWSDIC